MSRICVKNLGKLTNEKQLKDLFGTKGEVTDVRIVKTKSGKSRQLAFLGFRTDVQAQEAINYFNNTFLETARIIVESAKKIGDQTLIETTRSKITKKKLEKASKDQALESQKAKIDALAAKRKLIKEPVQSKEKMDFMEAMKPRRTTQFWANDESLPFTEEIMNVDIDDQESKGYSIEDQDDDSDADDDGINDFTNTASKIGDDKNTKKSESEKLKEASTITKSGDDSKDASKKKKSEKKTETKISISSDLDYLRSKVKVHFSDEENSDINEDNCDSEAESDDEMMKKYSTDESIKKIDGMVVSSSSSEERARGEAEGEIVIAAESDADEFEDSGRLFVRNLTFSCSEDEIRILFEPFGPVTTVHLPLDAERKSKGFGFVQFVIPEQAQKAREELDGSSFQGRLLHVINAKRAPEVTPKEGERGGSKLSSFQQKKEEDRRKMAGKTEGWNASFVRSDAVVDSLAERYGVSGSDILDRTEGGGEMAVRLAIGEAHVIQENRDYFSSHGVDLTALESHASSSKASGRSTTTLLIKNLPHDVIEGELESMFSRFGNIATLLIPKSKSVALVDFIEPTEARAAFKGLAYRKYHNVPIYLEWAPIGIIDKGKAKEALKKAKDSGKDKMDEVEEGKTGKKIKGMKEADDEESYSTLFIKNLNFDSDNDSLRGHIENLGVKGLRTVSVTKKSMGDKMMSMGFGFAEFRSRLVQVNNYSSICIQL